ncbi:MAG: hypothetical protein AAFZ17_19110 [Cyanobacteria bacterium J06650_10]
MKLVIREYLSMLRESGELDVLLPDLLLGMGIQPLSKAQVGVRQYGVDVAACGIDNDDIQKLFLLTIKQGDLSRKTWDDGSPQAVRPSLNEIIDTYLNTHVHPAHQKLPKKIVVCCNGDMKQEVEPAWTGFTKNNSKEGEVEFDFWGADRLSLLVEEYLLDEFLFPEQSRKNLRKTIALADQLVESPIHFYKLIEMTLFENSAVKPSKTVGKASKSQLKVLSLLNLNLNVVFYWSRELDNLRTAFLCAEQMLLRVWDWMRLNGLLDDKKVIDRYLRIIKTYFNVMSAFTLKVEPHCSVEHGLFKYGIASEIEYPLRTFEVIGLLSSFGIVLLNLQDAPLDEDMRRLLPDMLRRTVRLLCRLIDGNPSASTPLYDEHSVDIVLSLILLQRAGQETIARRWVKRLNMNIISSYRMGRFFPVHTNSYEDLVTLMFDKTQSKQKLMLASTILPILSEWYSVLEMQKDYPDFRENVSTVFSHTNLMIWFPDDSVDEHLYASNAGYACGVGRSVLLHDPLSSIRDRISQEKESSKESYRSLSCVRYNLFSLAAIASRHFRTPVLPYLWQHLQPELV